MKQNIAEWLSFTNCKNCQELLLAAECVLDTVEYLDEVKADYDGLVDDELNIMRDDLADIYHLIMDCHDSVRNSYSLLAKQIPELPVVDEYCAEE